MRRLVLIFMMCLLPLQWSWAAAASVCEHERDSTHFGHHEHKHSGADNSNQASPDTSDDGSVNGHPDCQACHGIGAASLASPAADAQAWVDHGPLPAYERSLPEPPIQTFLRPPLNLVA